jgi:UDP-glucose 4-epimerase
MGKRVAVIGGSGFIGKHIVDKLLAAGHSVTVFDIMAPGRSDVRHIYMHITNFPEVVVALAGGFDAIYMLAAVANVNDVYNSPVESTNVNVVGVANILEAARRSNAGRVILSSTVWVYDMSDDLVVDENTRLEPSKAKHVYTANKLAAETMFHAYRSLYGVPYTILRYGIPYGPGARGATVAAAFVRKALLGEPMTIEGDGSQQRNFVYVEDLAAGNVAALNEVAIDQVYNLDGKRPVSILEVAETIQRILGSSAKIEFKPARPGDYISRTVVSEKAKRELGWEPVVELEEGLRRYIDWYRQANGL